jgi:hypothetical protein
LFVGFWICSFYLSGNPLRSRLGTISVDLKSLTITNIHLTVAAMAQQGGAPEGAHQAARAEPSDENNSSRPALPDRAESALPPHLRSSVIGVPVTPGITRETYESEPSEESGATGGAAQTGDYFSRRDVDHAVAASPAPDATKREGQSFENKVVTGAKEGSEFMRRVSVAALSTPTKESMSDIRAISPDLSLTGNIISATFNIPHSLKYHKGADWVCYTFSLFPFALDFPAISHSHLPLIDREPLAKLWMVGLMSLFPYRN